MCIGLCEEPTIGIFGTRLLPYFLTLLWTSVEGLQKAVCICVVLVLFLTLFEPPNFPIQPQEGEKSRRNDLLGSITLVYEKGRAQCLFLAFPTSVLPPAVRGMGSKFLIHINTSDFWRNVRPHCIQWCLGKTVYELSRMWYSILFTYLLTGKHQQA